MVVAVSTHLVHGEVHEVRRPLGREQQAHQEHCEQRDRRHGRHLRNECQTRQSGSRCRFDCGYIVSCGTPIEDCGKKLVAETNRGCWLSCLQPHPYRDPSVLLAVDSMSGEVGSA